jgi:hypothetical protein
LGNLIKATVSASLLIRVFCERWWAQLLLTEADLAAGYWWGLAMCQVEVSGMVVFDVPTRARSLFEALCIDTVIPR